MGSKNYVTAVEEAKTTLANKVNKRLEDDSLKLSGLELQTYADILQKIT